MRLAVICLLTCALAGPALGDANMEEAKRHFSQGVALYNDGNFNAALAEFEAAYKIKQSPAVLYNIGLTHKSLFHYNEAIESLQQYLAADKKMPKERQKEVQQLVSEMRALLAEVTLNIIPDGAQVKLDDRTIGQSPMKPYLIAAGNHTLEVLAEGYQPQKKEILVSAGQALTINLKLTAIPKSGKAHITASQPNSTVTVDSKLVGVAPVDVELPLGGHQLEVRSKGYSTYHSELVVAGGQVRDVNVILELPVAGPHKWYTKWYVWVPVGAAVAIGLGVGLGVGLQKPSPLVGTLDPGAQPVN
jgi:prefoldin subunit 5